MAFHSAAGRRFQGTRKGRKGHSAAKPQPKEFATDYTDYTDKQILFSAFPLLFPIRVIRVIRGKIFAKLGDSDGLQRKGRMAQDLSSNILRVPWHNAPPVVVGVSCGAVLGWGDSAEASPYPPSLTRYSAGNISA